MSIPGSSGALFLATAAGAGGYQVERSLRFNSSDSVFCSRAVSTTSTRKIFTISAWVKRSRFSTGGFQAIYNADTFKTDFFGFNTSTDQIRVFISGADNGDVSTAAVFRDPSAWYHILFSIDTTQVTPSNRIRVYVNGTEQTLSGTFPVQDYVFTKLFNTAYTQYIGRCAGDYGDFYLAEYFCIDGQALTPSSFTEVSATTGQLIPKAYTGTFGTNGFWLQFADNSNNTATTLGKDTSGNGNNWTPNNFSVTQSGLTGYYWATGYVFTTANDAGNFNTDSGTRATYASNDSWGVYAITGSTSVNVTWWSFAQARGFGYYFSNDPSIRVASSVPWVAYTAASRPGAPAAATLSNPNGYKYIYVCGWLNGVFLPTGFDTGGDSLYFYSCSDFVTTPSGQNTILQTYAGNDSLVDTPTSYGTDTGAGGEVRGNYCTLNALAGGGTLANGNLDFLGASGGAQRYGTIGVASGKWYWEVTVTAGSGSSLPLLGIGNNPNQAGLVGIFGYYGFNGNKYADSTATAYGASYTVNDVVSVAFDADNGTLTFYKNGASQGQAFTGISGTYFPYFRADTGTSVVANFGQRPFAFPAPSGFKALCDTNLPAPVVAKSSDYFQTVLYTGNGSTQTISGLGFSPDLVWAKSRSAATNHGLIDTVRGRGFILVSDLTVADQISPAGADLASFDANGFTLGAPNAIPINVSGQTYVAWTWDAGTTTASNPDGSITSSVRANASAGFSIVSWTGNATNGATVGHGLGVKPHLVIYKNRSDADNWPVISDVLLGAQGYMYLNSTAGVATAPQIAAPTSTVLTLSSYNDANGSGDAMIAYCFSPVAGYSSFGSYTGNGSTDGPFVYTGFRPRWILRKRTDTSGPSWRLIDTARNPYNLANEILEPNTSDATENNNEIDVLSNGFKVRSADTDGNANGGTIIYAAFAESPFSYSRAR